jgi:hypothetical protein
VGSEEEEEGAEDEEEEEEEEAEAAEEEEEEEERFICMTGSRCCLSVSLALSSRRVSTLVMASCTWSDSGASTMAALRNLRASSSCPPLSKASESRQRAEVLPGSKKRAFSAAQRSQTRRPCR